MNRSASSNRWLREHVSDAYVQRARAEGDYLIVALSTEEFNAGKGKRTYHDFETRKLMLESVRYVDLVIPEDTWDQKIGDVQKYEVDAVVMGGDWAGDPRFEILKDYCEVMYLDRTEGISTSKIKKDLGVNS